MDGYLAKPIKADELYAAIAPYRLEGEAFPEPTQVPPMDLAEALALADGDRPLVAELMAGLLAAAPDQLAMLRTALKDSDARRLEYTAHSLKGALGAVGATRAQELAQQLEAQGRADQLEGALSLWQQLDTELAQLAAFWAQACATEQVPGVPI
jgi:HPt (histidine-containing phosphotransfer) domain-containing protein